MASVPSIAVGTKKKKRRWTKKEKCNKKQRLLVVETQQEQNERIILKCAKKAAHTESVKIIASRDSPSESLPVQVLTLGSQKLSTYQPNALSITRTIVVTKPLLVLDMNGILCHRIRRDLYPNIPFRPCIKKNIANTDIVARPDIEVFLNFLAQHFCLAIWTSAKPRTAQQLVKAIIPQHIQKKLLFVWAQNQCHRQQQQQQVATSTEEHDERNAIFIKSLDKIYLRFPIYSSHNTILLDDSPEKIAEKDINNTLHPQPMHGKLWHRSTCSREQEEEQAAPSVFIISDEENNRRQFEFFKSLAHHFESKEITDNEETKEDLLSFLDQQGRLHMGYRGRKFNVR